MREKDSKNKFSYVGEIVQRNDGLEKVTGSAKFADDLIFPQMLYGVMVRIPHSHAEIKKIDYSGILASPELTAICDSSDIPGKKDVGPIRSDQPIFCHSRVRTPGDVICMLLGESKSALHKLKTKVKIDYNELPLLLDPKKALEKNAVLIHPRYKNNLIVHYPLRKGNIKKGFSDSDEIIEETYTTQNIEHAYLEPESVIAFPLEGDKGIRIVGSIQNPFTARKVVADVLGWPLIKVRVEQAELGGSFGGKDDIMNILSARAAIGALKTGRTVKITYSREESILESYKRHPYIMHYKVGFKKSGKIRAMEIDILADGGAYSSMSPFVTWRTVVQATGPYEIENVSTDVKAVYTNNPYTGAMRGFGSPQPIFAQESIIDEIAIRLNKTPHEIRNINMFRQGSKTASGQILKDHEVNLDKIVAIAVNDTNFSKKWKRNHSKGEARLLLNTMGKLKSKDGQQLKSVNMIDPKFRFRKGIGMAVSYRGCSLGAEGIDAAAAYIILQRDGTAYILSGLAENGQGLKSTFSIIAGEVFGIKPEHVFYLNQDTGFIADSGPTVASRSTLMGGSAVKNAADIIKERLAKVFRKKFKLSPKSKVYFKKSGVFSDESGASMKFADLCDLAYLQGVNLSAIGWYKSPKVHWEENTGTGSAYFTYVYGCQIAEVKVDTITGEVHIEKISAYHNPGKVINKLGALGQVYGGVAQGAGYALWEDITNKDGLIRELNFDTYLIPTSKDIGIIQPVFVEGEDKHGPWGAKSLGEPTLELTAAAIGNAIRNATGIRYYNLPINLEEIVLGYKLSPGLTLRGSTE